MQDKRRPKARSRKAADQGVIADDDLRRQWRIAAELVEMLRNSGYECEILAEQDLH
jgi:hypothetical protein